MITWHKETGAVNPENQQQSPWTQRGTEEGGQNDFGQLHPPHVTPFLVQPPNLQPVFSEPRWKASPLLFALIFHAKLYHSLKVAFRFTPSRVTRAAREQ